MVKCDWGGKSMSIKEALEKVKQGKGMLIVKNPIKRNQKALTFTFL